MNADEVRRGWARRSGEFSPGYYAYYGPNETSGLVRSQLDRFVEPDAAVLELGCSAGRHLQYLHAAGFSDLHGLDINVDAFDVMAAEYPELADAATLHRGAIEDLLPGFDDGRFDAVFSVETLQHVHADATAAFAEVARVAGDLVVTVESERAVGPTSPAAAARGTAPVTYANGDFPLYYRDWEAIFTGFGLAQVDVVAVGGDTMRAFRRA